MKISFEEFVTDVLDLQFGLMTEQQIADAKAHYQDFTAPKPRQPKHPDAGKKVIELREKLDRLLKSQIIAAERNTDLNLSATKMFIAQATEALNGKAKKSELLQLITLNSEVSRDLNNQLNMKKN